MPRNISEERRSETLPCV